MLKKSLSVLMAVLMVVSMMAVAVVTTSALELESNKLYFDTDGSGWNVGSNKIGFYVFSLTTGEDDTLPWGSKKLNGTQIKGTTVWEYDPAKRGMNLKDGEQYAIIFTCGSTEAYSLLFDTTCLGHVAHAVDLYYENPVDSSKKSQVTFWDDLDAATYGPRLQLSSTGKVIGTCVEDGKTAESIFTDFLASEGAQSLANARKYTVDVNKMTEQELIDSIGEGLGLTKSFIRDAFAEVGMETAWSYDASTLPAGEVPHEHTPGEPVRENVKEATCTEEGSYDEVVYCTEDGEEISRETKTIEKLAHTPGEPTVDTMSYIPATCEEEGSMTMVTVCTVCGEVLSRDTETIPALGHDWDEGVVTTTASCEEEGELTYTCKNDASHTKTETIPALGHDLTLVEEVPATEEAEGTKAHYVCSVCGKLFDAEDSTKEVTAEELVIAKLSHVHTPGEPTVDSMSYIPATCEEDGSQTWVTVCTTCGEVLSRKTEVIPALGHDLVFVPEKAATNTVDGMKEHYECTRCGKLFADATGTVEVTAEDLVIKAELVRGDADESGELEITDATTIQRVLAEIPVEKYNAEAADADLDKEVSIIDVTLIQRVVAKMITFERWDELNAA